MTKHSKQYMTGGHKMIKNCPMCDYSTIGSIKDVESRFKLHMKNKHGMEKAEADKKSINLGRVSTTCMDFYSNEIKTPSELLHLIKK